MSLVLLLERMEHLKHHNHYLSCLHVLHQGGRGESKLRREKKKLIIINFRFGTPDVRHMMVLKISCVFEYSGYFFSVLFVGLKGATLLRTQG